MDDAQFAETIRQAKRGRGRAFADLVQMVEGPLVGFARSRGSEDPEAIANQALVNVFRAIDEFDGDKRQFRAWLFTVTRNLLIDEYRRRNRRPDAVSTDPAKLLGLDAVNDPDPVVERDSIEEMLIDLTDAQREIVLLRIVAGLSVEETAQVTGRKPGAVRALQFRALRQLRRTFAVPT